MGQERRKKSLKSILPDSLEVIEEENTERSEDPSSVHSDSQLPSSCIHAVVKAQGSTESHSKYRRKKSRRRSLESGGSSKSENTASTRSISSAYSFPDLYSCTDRSKRKEDTPHEVLRPLSTNPAPSTPFEPNSSSASLDYSIVEEVRQFISFPLSPVQQRHPPPTKRLSSPMDNTKPATTDSEEGNTGATPLFNYDEDFDEDQAQELDTEEEQLSWRMDPSKSLSDWTLKIFNKETRQAETYHVHKNLLAVGPKKSEYFVRMFRTNNRLDVGTKTTEIYMESVAATVVPQWLDFLYALDDALEVDTESATGLRHLAQFFGIRIMHKKAMSFITRDLSMDNVIVYYKDSVVLADDKISEIAAKHCSKNILKIDTGNDLLTTVDPFFFRRLMSGPDIDSKEKQYHVSRLLARYCALNTNVLDEQSFQRLTEEKFLPLVDRSAALTLMEMEADLVLVNLDEEQLQEITSLQTRCIRDLTQNWQLLGEDARDQVVKVCRKLPSNVVAELLVKSIAEAKKSVNGGGRSQSPAKVEILPETSSHSRKGTGSLESTLKLDAAHAVKVKDLKKEYDAKISALKREHQKALDKLQKDCEAKLIKLRDICVEKDSHITNYWDELKRFQRLPNQPEGKIVPSGLTAKPSKMPSIGNQAQDGYLLLSKGKGGMKHPIFFYNVDVPPWSENKGIQH